MSISCPSGAKRGRKFRWQFGGSPMMIAPIDDADAGLLPSERELKKLEREIRRMQAKPGGAPGHRGQQALIIYDGLRAGGLPHTTDLLDRASKAAGLTGRRRLEQLLRERNTK